MDTLLHRQMMMENTILFVGGNMGTLKTLYGVLFANVQQHEMEQQILKGPSLKREKLCISLQHFVK